MADMAKSKASSDSCQVWFFLYNKGTAMTQPKPEIAVPGAEACYSDDGGSSSLPSSPPAPSGNAASDHPSPYMSGKCNSNDALLSNQLEDFVDGATEPMADFLSAADSDDNDTFEQHLLLLLQQEEEDIYVARKEDCGNYELDNKEFQPYRAADPPEDPPDDDHCGTRVFYYDNEPELARPRETTNKDNAPFKEYAEANNNRVVEDHTGGIRNPETYDGGDGNAFEAGPEITVEPSNSFNCAEMGVGEPIDALALKGFGHGFADFDQGTVGEAAVQ